MGAGAVAGLAKPFEESVLVKCDVKSGASARSVNQAFYSEVDCSRVSNAASRPAWAKTRRVEMFKAPITFLLGSAIIGVYGSAAHADWAVLSAELGVTLIGAVSADAASGEPDGANFSATCIKGRAGDGLLSFAFTHTPAAKKISVLDEVPAAYRLIIDGDEIVRVSSGPNKITTAAGTLAYTFTWSVNLMKMFANAQKEVTLIFDGDPTFIAVPARGSGNAVRSFLLRCR
jgi:hypothetical protein